jgi:hypothetical protein
MEETNDPITPAEPVGLVLTEEAQYFLREAGRWARFLGIMSFIGAGFVFLIAIFFGAFTSLMSSYSYNRRPFPPVLGGGLGFVLYTGVAVICFFIALYLYQFGNSIKQAIEFSDSQDLTIAFGKLKSFFKLKGIIVIIFVSLYALIILGVIIAFLMFRH